MTVGGVGGVEVSCVCGWLVGGGRVGLGHRFARGLALGACVCGRRLATGSCVSVRQTTSTVVKGLF